MGILYKVLGQINPTANVANVAKNAAVGLSAGKNFVEITTAKLPKM